MDADGNLARSVPGRERDIMHIVSRTGTLSLTAQLPHHLAPTVCSLFFNVILDVDESHVRRRCEINPRVPSLSHRYYMRNLPSQTVQKLCVNFCQTMFSVVNFSTLMDTDTSTVSRGSMSLADGYSFFFLRRGD